MGLARFLAAEQLTAALLERRWPLRDICGIVVDCRAEQLCWLLGESHCSIIPETDGAMAHAAGQGSSHGCCWMTPLHSCELCEAMPHLPLC